jgi:predicted secreted protein
MNARRRIFTVAAKIIWIASTLTLFGDQSEVWAMGKEPEVILRKQDNGKEVKLKAGQSFQIQLEAAGGTGYWWHVQTPDARHVELLGEKNRDQSEGRLGGPVLGIWTFQAKEAGTTEIKMACYRTWEGLEKAIEKFRVKITVE